jgi:hypothetical protein
MRGGILLKVNENFILEKNEIFLKFCTTKEGKKRTYSA